MAESETVNVRLAVLVGVMVLSSKDEVTPVGKPLTSNVTSEEKPLLAVKVTLRVAELP